MNYGLRIPLLLVSLFLLVSCGGDNNVLAPQFQPEIVNQTDAFQFQATDVTGVTQTLAYTWQNTGVSANVNQSCSVSGGTAGIVVRDASGQVVYEGDLTNDGTFQSLQGAAGAWSIQVTLTDVAGTLNFRLEMRA